MPDSPERKMFYGAKPITFIRARDLREQMTDAEKLLWERIRKNQLLGFRFKAQHPIDCFIADFYCHKGRLVIEVDGRIHNHQVEYDKDRSYFLKSLGITILRFRNEEIENDIERVISKISEYLLNAAKIISENNALNLITK